ncbi:acyl-CoA dehydrogenase family protein [Streptacidiphilus fuscans]|uniref:Acyl-CoA dehydrogenase family protein n=1 Tax=Streptacidiphilus fuscans TaxID=2789292 RepID=A0A931B5R1_9ACTN|nr:acyl-CoA dehydrogenase family protein [Streptacidiphilus fuscans]MBF9069496.1 acyl-CoA dehydrogenase family protein [Streptacidiphilus fuscans]
MSVLPVELCPLTPEQNDIVELTRSFAQEEIRPRARAVDEADTQTPWDLWRAAAKVGITGFMLPEEYGGGGFTDVFSQCLVQEELCVGDLGIGNLLCSNGFFADPVLELGTEEQKRTWLTPLAGPDTPMTSLATTEPGAGSDAGSITTTATRTTGGYLLNGQKAWISNAGEADFYVVFAKTDPAARARGVSAFLLRKDTEGMTFGEPMRKMGQRAIVCREVFLADAFVPEENLLGAEGQGFKGLMRTFDISRTVLGAAATGVARAAYEYARDYARTRVQFGKPIIEHQAVAFRLADMRTRIDQSRLMTWRAAKRLDAGLDATSEAAMAKLTASETAAWCTWAAVQTLGGWGYSREYPVEQWMRDAKLEEIEEGTSDIMRLVISRGL